MTRVSQSIDAPRSRVYRALLDRDSVREWMVPTGMTSEIHDWDPRVGGTFRISLTYDDPNRSGKTASHTDTFRGRFVELVPDTKVVQAIEFETTNPAMMGESTITYTLSGETVITATHENVPRGIKPEDNELGFRLSLGKLAALCAR